MKPLIERKYGRVVGVVVGVIVIGVFFWNKYEALIELYNI